MSKDKSTPLSNINKLTTHWISKINIQYQPLTSDIFKTKQPERLAELLCAIDYHAIHDPSLGDDLGVDIGYGQQLNYGIIPVNKKLDSESIDVKTYVAVTVVGSGDNAKVVIITADDQDRLDLYMSNNKVEANSEDFKSGEVLVVLKDLQKDFKVKDEDIYYVNYTLPGLEKRATSLQSDESRDYLRFTMQQVGGRNPKWSDVVYDNAGYLAEKLNNSQVNGIAYSDRELRQIKEIANNMEVPDAAENKEFEHGGHTYDTETAINKIVFNRLLIKGLEEKVANLDDVLKKYFPNTDKNANVRVTCGDHKAVDRVYWHAPEQVLDELHKAGLHELSLDDITEKIKITRRSCNANALAAALEDAGLDIKNMKNTGFSIKSDTNTNVFKERYKDDVESDIASIKKSIDNKMDMYEPEDEEINEVESAQEIGYGVGI